MPAKNYTIYLILEEDDHYDLPKTIKQRKISTFDDLSEAEQEIIEILDDNITD
tara:strand:+ start:2259 stop:2417 length:159 start_codon:yes stop_codon:yes gene_type:complete